MNFAREETERRLESLLEEIAKEPWMMELSNTEENYIKILREYGRNYGNFDLYCEKYIRIINLKEIAELERRKS